MINGLVVYVELEHEIVQWTTSIANSLVLICDTVHKRCSVARSGVMSNGTAYVHTNDVALRRIALQNIRRSSWTLNWLALHEIFRCCGESSSLIVAWREGYLAETAKNTNCKGNDDLLGGMTSSNVKIGAKLSHGVVASLHFAVPILFTDCYTETGRKLCCFDGCHSSGFST